MKIFQWFHNLIFSKPKFKILPIKVTGDTLFTPSVSINGDWSQYISQPYEGQNQNNWDEQNCVCQSGINVVEAILNYYYKNNLFPQVLLDFIKNNGYLNDQGFIKLSTRFQSKMSGTTTSGVGMDDFWISVNRDGILPYTAYPDPSGAFDWNKYYQPVPQPVIDAGKTAAKIFHFTWQAFENNNWNPPLISELKNVLKSSPIHWAGMCCAVDAGGIERWCKANYYVHARAIYGVGDYINVLDSEMPALKKLELRFPIACAIKVQLQIK